MSEIIFQDWRNSNMNVKYPFIDNATLKNGDGDSIDQDLFEDARIYPIGGHSGAFISKVKFDGTYISFVISDSVTANTASGKISKPVTSGTIELLDVYGRQAGVLVSTAEKLENLFGRYKQGETVFTSAATEFVPTVVTSIVCPGVQGFVLDDGSFISGNVYLCGTDGIVLSADGDEIRVDIVGDPYANVKNCAEDGTPITPFCGLKTINGIGPDSNGDFKLTTGANQQVDNIFRVAPSGKGLRLMALGGKVNNGRT